MAYEPRGIMLQQNNLNIKVIQAAFGNFVVSITFD